MHRATCLTSVQTVLRAPLKEAGGWKIALSLLLRGYHSTLPILLVTQAVSPGERVHLALLCTACASSLFCSLLFCSIPCPDITHCIIVVMLTLRSPKGKGSFLGSLCPECFQTKYITVFSFGKRCNGYPLAWLRHSSVILIIVNSGNMSSAHFQSMKND